MRGFRTPKFEVRSANWRVNFRTSDFRLPTSDFRLPTSDFRLQTSDFGLLHDSWGKKDYQFLLLFRIHTALEELAQIWDIAQKRDFADTLGAAFLDQSADDDSFVVVQAHDGGSLFNVEHGGRAIAARG